MNALHLKYVHKFSSVALVLAHPVKPMSNYNVNECLVINKIQTYDNSPPSFSAEPLNSMNCLGSGGS